MRRQTEDQTIVTRLKTVPPEPPAYVPEEPDEAEVRMLEHLEQMKTLGQPQEKS
mgnify:CR=1 FL=1